MKFLPLRHSLNSIAFLRYNWRKMRVIMSILVNDTLVPDKAGLDYHFTRSVDVATLSPTFTGAMPFTKIEPASN